MDQAREREIRMKGNVAIRKFDQNNTIKLNLHSLAL